MENQKDKLMIAVSVTSGNGKTKSTIELIDNLYKELVVKRSAEGWTAEFLNTKCRPPRMQPYILGAMKYDRMVVFKQKQKETETDQKRIAVVTWGDVWKGPVAKSYKEILKDIDQYDIIVGCCHPTGDVWNFFKRVMKPLVSTFIVLSTYRMLKPNTGFDKWNGRFAKHLESIILDKIDGKF